MALVALSVEEDEDRPNELIVVKTIRLIILPFRSSQCFIIRIETPHAVLL